MTHRETGRLRLLLPLPTKSKMRYAGDANASYNYLLYPRISVLMRALISASHCFVAGVLPCAIRNRQSAVGNWLACCWREKNPGWTFSTIWLTGFSMYLKMGLG